MNHMDAPMHAQVLGSAGPDAMGGGIDPMAPAAAGGLPSMQPMMYQQIMADAQQQWAAEDAQIHSARQAALYQAVLAAVAPAQAMPALPVDAPVAG